MNTSAVQSIKLAVVSATGLSKDALHIYIGLAVFLTSAALLRKPLRSAIPWAIVLALAVAGEIVDMRDDIHSFGHWRWSAGLHDIVNTIFWPTILALLARSRALVGVQRGVQPVLPSDGPLATLAGRG